MRHRTGPRVRTGSVHRVLAAGVLTVLALLMPGWLPEAAGAAPAPGADSVQVTVLQLTPGSPEASATAQPLDVVLKLTNTTDQNLGPLRVEGARGNPISNQNALDAAIADPQAPDPTLAGRFSPTTPVTATLLAHASVTVTYASTTAQGGVDAGLCMCESRIYPLYFSVLADTGTGSSVIVGSAQTFIPSFAAGQTPQPVQVSWVWPILERPHRNVHDNEFTDDDLARSVDVGGRLDRVLQVVEQVDPSIPMTLLVDPDLIDELAVMAAGKYTVRTNGRTAPGTGTTAAQNWLLRLRAALATHPGLELAFTPFADPDVESLVRSNQTWALSQSTGAQARVSAATGDYPARTDIAWPVNGTLSPSTLDALGATGVHTVIAADTSLLSRAGQAPPANALATIPTEQGTTTVAVTSSRIEEYADQVLTRGRAGLGRLPELVSEVAVRAVDDSTHSHFVVITPPRNVDPDPAIAVAAIKATADTSWSRPLALGIATRSITPVDHGALNTARPNSGLPDDLLASAAYVSERDQALTDLIPDLAERTQLIGSLADGVQRLKSSEWVSDPLIAAQHAQQLRDLITTVTDGVHLVKPTTGTYTLGSADSPLPITIDNTLDAEVKVRVQVSTVGGLPGFTADDLGVQTIQARSKLPLHIPVHIDRVGRMKVQVSLTTTDGAAIGAPLPLSIRSTALGDIGKLITFAAAVVLGTALLVRLVRRLRRRRNRSTGDPV